MLCAQVGSLLFFKVFLGGAFFVCVDTSFFIYFILKKKFWKAIHRVLWSVAYYGVCSVFRVSGFIEIRDVCCERRIISIYLLDCQVILEVPFFFP